MKRWLLIALYLPFFAGCASPSVERPPVEDFLRDQLFMPAVVAPQRDNVFAIDAQMRRHLAVASAQARVLGDPLESLVWSLLDDGRVRIDYDAQVTRNAAETFDARAGNCLSLVIMTVAMAKELGLRVKVQQFESPGVWDRQGNLLLNVGHVNVMIGRQQIDSRTYDRRAPWITVDFLPVSEAERARTVEVDEARVLAMYFNNRAAETLTATGADAAYWWARAAVLADPGYADAFNTLGVVYSRHKPADSAEAADAAERALRHALALNRDNAHAMGNLAALLDGQGRASEAAALRAALRRLEPTQPFTDYDEGLRAMRSGDFKRARSFLERELRKSPYFHELHMNLARVYLQLGDIDSARKQIEQARDTSTTRQQQALYSAKLDVFRKSLGAR
jgi:Tfp pilus assembly protein PilF